jgi:hypothetical protein
MLWPSTEHRGCLDRDSIATASQHQNGASVRVDVLAGYGDDETGTGALVYRRVNDAQ